MPRAVTGQAEQQQQFLTRPDRRRRLVAVLRCPERL